MEHSDSAIPDVEKMHEDENNASPVKVTSGNKNKIKKPRIDNEDDDDMIDEDDSNESDSQDDDDEEEDDNEASGDKEMLNEDEYKKKLDELEALIGANKYQYQYYVDIIKLTRDNGDLNKLREYRQKMSELYPLTESMAIDIIPTQFFS
jgi:hypothetical protein